MLLMPRFVFDALTHPKSIVRKLLKQFRKEALILVIQYQFNLKGLL
jgi:hypothetical protein